MENLSTLNVDKLHGMVCNVESVEKLSTTLVDKCKSGKKEKRTELSTLIVDNSVEKCAEVLLAVARIIVPGLRLWLLN